MLTLRDRLTVQLILLVARIVCEEKWEAELKTLANHIEYAKESK